jgi:class 3 adenylate cyclase
VQELWSADEAVNSGLAVGDRLLAVGSTDLGSSGPLGFVARVYSEARGRLAVPIRFERDHVRHDAILRLIPVPYPWRTTIIAFSFAAIGIMAFWGARGSRPARLFFVSVLFYALHWCYFWGGPRAQTYAAVAVFLIAPGLAAPFALRTILVFPEEVARFGRWASYWPWLFACTGFFVSTWAFGFPLPTALGLPFATGASVAFIVVALVLLARSYRRAGAFGRRQLRWVLFGFYAGLAPAGFAGALATAVPALWWVYEVSLGAVIAIPICLFIAIARNELFDVDRIITAATSYTILSILLLSLLFSGIPLAVRALQGVVDPRVTQTTMALVFAALFLPAQRRIEAALGRVFLAERHALEQGAGELREALSGCSTPAALLTLLGERLAGLLRLDSIVIYGRTDGSYAPVFAWGRGVPPAFDASGPLISRLLDLRRITYTRRLVDARGAAAVSSPERAALEALGADLVLPLMLHERLAAFLCLGEKHSGDVFTPTDLALLESIADKAHDQLLRFDQAQVYRQEQELNEKLRRYVPGAVAEGLLAGSLDAGEREVTVLFVDIRSYTRFSEGRRVEAIFGLVNRYTQLTSRLVADQGGAVVEFNGDGMMAVFGAPRTLPGKERAALRAARSIVKGMRRLPTDERAASEAAPLDVGIGIATGAAFVGSVRAADRMIWTALGNTTNLAARLQTLSAQLEASIVIDGATFTAAGAEAVDFEMHPRVVIRGRSAPVDLYALPRNASISAVFREGKEASHAYENPL